MLFMEQVHNNKGVFMKKIAIALCTVISIASQVHAALPTEIAKLQGRPGTLVTTMNGEVYAQESNIPCTVEESEYGEGSVIISAGTYFTPTAHLDDAERSVKGDSVVYTTTSNGKRPGGSVCGDMVPLTSYKQTVTVTKNSISLKEKFSCAVVDRNEIVQTCTVR